MKQETTRLEQKTPEATPPMEILINNIHIMNTKQNLSKKQKTPSHEQNTQEVIFQDPDQALYGKWGQRPTKTTGELVRDTIYPYSSPKENNIQITPYKGPRRIEYGGRFYLDPEPRQQKEGKSFH